MWRTLDLRSLALFRAMLGVAIIADLVARLGSLDMYGGASPLPARFLAGPSSVTLFVDDMGVVIALFAVQAAAAIGLVVGFQTRIMTALSLLLAISLHARLPLSAYNGDLLLRALLVWGLMLPLAARASVDSRFSFASGAHRSLASAGLVVQVALVFFTAGVVKLWVPVWRDGSAVELLLAADMYATPLGFALGEAAPSLLPFFSYSTLVLELVAPILLFLPWWRVRTVGVMLIAALLVGIGLTMTVGQFPLVSMAGVCALLPSRVWRSEPQPVSSSGRIARALAAVCLVVVVATSAGGALHVTVQGVLPWPLYSLGISQNWSMFEDPAVVPRGFVRILGVKEDGSLLDLATRAPARLDEVPPPFATLLPFRERRLWEQLVTNPKTVSLHPLVAAWMCRRFSDEKLARVRFEQVDWVGSDAVRARVVFDVACE